MENVLALEKEISIFKTSIIDPAQIPFLKNILDKIVGQCLWNFDLEDKDNILRIKAHPWINSFLIQEINKLGFECVELY